MIQRWRFYLEAPLADSHVLIPWQHCNLARSRPEVVQTMLKRLAEYNATAVPCQYPPPSKLCDPSRYDGYFSPWGDGDSKARMRTLRRGSS
jgi:hypothetical protein